MAFDLRAAMDNKLRFFFETTKDRLEYQTLINIEAETIEAKLIKDNKEAADLDAIFNLGKSYISENNGKKDEGLQLCKSVACLMRASIFLSNYYANINEEESSIYSMATNKNANYIIEYDELINKNNNLKTDDFYKELENMSVRHEQAARRPFYFLGDRDNESRFIVITDENKKQAFKWFTYLESHYYICATYKLAQMYSEGFVEDESKSSAFLHPKVDGCIVETIDHIENIKENSLLEKAAERFFFKKLPYRFHTDAMILSIVEWLENIPNKSALHLTALGQIYFYLSEREVNRVANLNKSFQYFYKAGNLLSEKYALGQYYSALLSLKDSILINEDQKKIITEWMESWIKKTPHRDRLKRKNKFSFSTKIEDEIIFYANTFSLRKNKKELEIKKEELELKNQVLDRTLKQLQEKDKDLEDMMSMFAHKFRSPLDAIIYNTTHENQVKLYTEAAQTMRGLLNIFSIISTDGDILKDKIKQDSQGSGNLTTVFSKTLDMILLHLLSVSGAEKIQQHYMAYAQRHGQCDETVSYKIWCEDYFELEQALQTEWEASYAQLLNQANSLEQRLAWLEEHFFKLDIIGFERTDIQFKEYATTESLLTILLNEILVNAFKYYSSTSKQSVVLEWVERDGNQVLICSNPSLRSERTIIKGSHKGHVFLSTLARKTGSLFSKPIPQDHFVLEFGIPNELLISK